MIKYIQPEDTLLLRSRMLRNNKPLEQCVFPTDQTGFHLGKVTAGKIVCIASFFPEDCIGQGTGGYKLRGMATDPDFMGMGYGTELINFAKNELIAANASYIWCNARSSAVGFYKKIEASKLFSDEFEVARNRHAF